MATILIIEPDTLLTSAYSRALEAAGHKVMAATNAQSAISLCDQQTPDCVVIELHLRAHSGFEFLYEFRSYYEWLEIPVLIHSLVPLNVLQKYQTSLSQLGITKCLYKPATSLKVLSTEVAATVAHTA